METKGISDITAERIIAWFGNPENYEIAQQLVKLWRAKNGATEALPAGDEPHEENAPTSSTISLAGVVLAPGDEIVATGAIAVTRNQIARW
jgi:hypothetical protein